MSKSKNQFPEPSNQALQRLISGNQNFVKGIHSVETNFSVEKMKKLGENGQSPFTIILTCSDSRVPTEAIFDQGIGSLFVIRVAGNVISPDVIASAEYAAGQFGSPLLMVMGHTSCGAVQAATQYLETGKCPLSLNGKNLLKKIVPSVRKAKRLASPAAGNFLDFVSLTNVRTNQLLLIKKSKLLSKLVSQKKIAIVGAVYNIKTGEVTFDSASSQPQF